MRLAPRRTVRLLLGLVLLVPLGILLYGSQVQAQKFGGGGGAPKGGGFQPPAAPKPPAFQPPSMPKMPGTQPPKAPGFQPQGGVNNPMVPIIIPPGGINQPGGQNQVTYVTVWRCNKCNGVVSHGSMKPSLNSCPNCGVLFNNGQNMFTSTTTPVNSSGSALARSDFSSVPFVFGGILFMLVDVGIMIAVVSIRVARA